MEYIPIADAYSLRNYHEDRSAIPPVIDLVKVLGKRRS